MGLESDHIDQQLIKVARTCAPFYLLSDPIVTSVLTINWYSSEGPVPRRFLTWCTQFGIQSYTLSHPETSLSTPEDMCCKMHRILYVSIPVFLFERVRKHTSCARNDVFVWNTCWRHGHSRVRQRIQNKECKIAKLSQISFKKSPFDKVPRQTIYPDMGNVNVGLIIVAGKKFLRRLQKLCVEICIAPNFPIHGNDVIDYEIYVYFE